MKRIIFFSHARLGDLHVSRSFVRSIAQHVSVPCYYYNAGNRILADCGLEVALPPDFQERYVHAAQSDFIEDDSLFVNTWYAAGEGRFVRDGQAALFDTLYRMFEHVATSRLGFSLGELAPPPHFLPDIDFSFFRVAPAQQALEMLPGVRRVLVANGRATAGQAPLFPMLPPLSELGRKHPDVLFIYTNREHEPSVRLPTNVVFSRDLIGIREGVIDLNECGYLSTRCHLIVGRFSGAYTFSMIQPNLLQRPARFLTFSSVARPHWLGSEMEGRIPLSCSVTQCRDVGPKPFVAQVEKELSQT